jgi:hypothetical protein
LRLQGLFAGQQRELTVTGLLWPRVTLRRSRIFEHALQKIACRAAALISLEKCAPTFDEWAAILHSCFRISLVNADALATIASVVGLVPTATFYKQLKNKQQTTGEKRGNKTTRSALVTAHGGAPGPTADSATLRAERRQPAM